MEKVTTKAPKEDCERSTVNGEQEEIPNRKQAGVAALSSVGADDASSPRRHEEHQVEGTRLGPGAFFHHEGHEEHEDSFSRRDAGAQRCSKHSPPRHQGHKAEERFQGTGFRPMRNSEFEMRSGLRVRVGGLTMKGMKDMKYESFYHRWR
jgi:hypothetical protein